ncbi:MAG: MFS transporter [Desulfobacteraceae bacterium]|jgi:MFS family permease
MIKRVFYGWWVVLACFLLSLYVGAVVFYGLTAFISPLKEAFGWSYTQISFAASLRGLEMGLFAPIIGFLVDRFGSRKLLLAGTMTIGLGLFSLSLTQSLVMFYASFLLLALGAGGCTSVVTMTAVANWFEKKVGIALGIMASGFGASGLLVPVIVEFIDRFSWRTTLIILGLGMWALGIPLSLVVRSKPEQYGYVADGHVSGDQNYFYEVQSKGSEIGFKEALRHKSFLYLNITETIRMMTVTAVVIHVMPYLSSVGVVRTTSGLVAAAIPLVSITGRFSFGWLGDVFDKRHLLAATFGLMGTGVFAFCYAQVPWLALLFLLLFPPGFGGGMVMRGAILREYFGTASFGKMLGIIMGAASLGGIMGPTLAGWIFDKLADYRFAWLLLCSLTFLAVGLISKIKPLQKDESARPTGEVNSQYIFSCKHGMTKP